MKVYMYQAALHCEPCGVAIREWLAVEAIANDVTGMPTPTTDETTYDSDQYPKGPYADGGGEADLPQHCDGCGVFLENPLTGEGYRYVEERIAIGMGKQDVLRTWAEFYGLSAPGAAVAR